MPGPDEVEPDPVRRRRISGTGSGSPPGTPMRRAVEQYRGTGDY